MYKMVKTNLILYLYVGGTTIMINATEAYEEARKNAEKISRENMEKEINNSIKNGKTRAIIDEVLSEDFAKELSKQGYDVMVFNAAGWTTSSIVDFSEKRTGKMIFTDDPARAGRKGGDIRF